MKNAPYAAALAPDLELALGQIRDCGDAERQARKAKQLQAWAIAKALYNFDFPAEQTFEAADGSLYIVNVTATVALVRRGGENGRTDYGER